MTEWDGNSDEMCDGIEVEEEEVSIGQCHNCRVLAEADEKNRLAALQRDRGKNDEDDDSDDDLEEVKF